MTWRDRTTLYPSRAAWLAARTLTLGASEAAALLGESPFAGPWDVWRAKRERDEVTEPQQYADTGGGVNLDDPLIRGQVLEPLVGRAYEAVTGNAQRDVGTELGKPGWIGITRHASEPWLTASLDAIVRIDAPWGEPDEGIGEWKTAKDSWKWGASGSILPGAWEDFGGLIPQHIGVQALVQLAVTDLPFCDVGMLTGGLAFRWYRVLRHEPTITALVAQLGHLWRLHVVQGEPPELDGSEACIAACRARLAAGRVKSRPMTPEEEEDYYTLLYRRDAEAAADRAKARILAGMGDCSRITLPPDPSGKPRVITVSAKGAVTAR